MKNCNFIGLDFEAFQSAPAVSHQSLVREGNKLRRNSACLKLAKLYDKNHSELTVKQATERSFVFEFKDSKTLINFDTLDETCKLVDENGNKIINFEASLFARLEALVTRLVRNEVKNDN